MVVQDRIPDLIEKEQNDECYSPTITDQKNHSKNENGSDCELNSPDIKGNTKLSKRKGLGDTFALKIINKSVLRRDEINVIRGESKILKSLVGKPNVVQFKNIFETKKFIII